MDFCGFIKRQFDTEIFKTRQFLFGEMCHFLITAHNQWQVRGCVLSKTKRKRKICVYVIKIYTVPSFKNYNLFYIILFIGILFYYRALWNYEMQNRARFVYNQKTKQQQKEQKIEGERWKVFQTTKIWELHIGLIKCNYDGNL